MSASVSTGCGVESATSGDPAPVDGKADTSGDDSTTACSSSEVHHISRPQFPDRAQSPSFSYAYRVVPGTDPTAPVVVYLPGGPGQTSIASDRAQLAIPERYTVVMTDPRGVGCNAPPPGSVYSDDFYTTDNIASDVVAMLSELQPEAYVLYGVSYGTLLGTVTAFNAEAAGLPPLAVVLEGVVTHSFGPGQEAAEYTWLWNKALDRLPPEVSSQLIGSELPLDLTATQWGGAISTMLSIGEITGTGNLLELNLAGLMPGTPEESQEALRSQLLQFADMAQHSSASADMIHLFERVGCREIAETNFDTFSLEQGELVPVGDMCADFEVTAPYYAGDYLLTTPIFYINGTRDPNTPHVIAIQHAAAQYKTGRAFISVIGGGHNPFAMNLAGCAPALWSSFENLGEGLEEALESCEAPTELKVSLGW